MLYNLLNEPIAPSHVVKLLQAIDPSLNLKYFPPGDLLPNGRWGIMSKWKLSDPRHSMIQKGEMAPGTDYDAVGWLPEDCPVEQARSYLERAFMRVHPREMDKYLERLRRANDEQQKENEKPVMEYAEELIETNAKTIFREQGKSIPKVFVTDQRSKLI